MARFLSGPDALRQCVHDDKVSTVFAASSKGIRVSIFQKPDGSTTWRFDEEVNEEECLSIFSDGIGFYMRLGSLVTAFPFRNADDFRSNYEFYTIDRVEVALFTGSSFSSLTFAADQILVAATPLIAYSIDRRNSNPENLESLLVNHDVALQQLDINRPIEVAYNPSASFNLAGVGATRALVQISPKLSTSVEQVDHFGVKFAAFGLNARPDADRPIALVSFIVKQYMTFYNQRVRVVVDP